jgi:hypothetical protein
VNDFGRYGKSDRDILIPQVQYLTNDSWEVVSAGRPLTGGISGYPILHRASYSRGTLYVLTVPDDFGNLYDYPAPALNEIRRRLCRDLDLYLEGPSKVSLFVYDNDTVIVENFNDEAVDVALVGYQSLHRLTDLESREEMVSSATAADRGRAPRRIAFSVPPHSYRAFHYDLFSGVQDGAVFIYNDY